MKAGRVLWFLTDHRFAGRDGAIYDRFGFDAQYFRGYLAEGVTRLRLVGRVESRATVEGLKRTSFDELEVHPLPNRNGLRWLATAVWTAVRIGVGMPRTERAVVRIPSILGLVTGMLLALRGVPFMAEVVGAPRDAIADDAVVGARFLARGAERLMSWVVGHATSVSYVSAAMERTFPAGPASATAHLSSIRLPGRDIGEARVYDRAIASPRVLCVASLFPWKGHAVLLRAFAKVREALPGATLHLIGDGPSRGDLEALVLSLGLGEAVRFQGHVSQTTDIFRALADADLFVLASLTEGLPRVVIEASARGVPAIATDAGGTRELLPAAQIAKVGDADDLTQRILTLLADPAAMRAASVAGVARARDFALERLSVIREGLVRATLEA